MGQVRLASLLFALLVLDRFSIPGTEEVTLGRIPVSIESLLLMFTIGPA